MTRTMRCLLLSGVAILSACASDVPNAIRADLPNSPLLQSVQNDPGHYQGQLVRWGGTIIAVRNQAADSEIDIVAKPLDDDGRPEASDQSPGRFIARFGTFADPEVFKAGRDITVVGGLVDVVKRPIGETEYAYPRIEPTHFHIWKEQPRQSGFGAPVRFGIGFGFGL